MSKKCNNSMCKNIKNIKKGNNVCCNKANIKRWVVIEKDCVIDKKTTIGPMAHIHGKSIIGKNCIVGNFVEVNRSILQDNVKIKHLSYIGDTTIGENTNIGAGVIICNYDGNFKHKTIIGKNCFIGSNCVLIAPLIIGDNCFIGANSIVKENLPNDTFFTTTHEHKIKKNNFKKIKKD